MKLNKPFRSKSPNKKFEVYAKDKFTGKVKHIHFGQKGYEDYTQHHDKQRRDNYLARSAGIKDSQGRLTKDNPGSANYWSRKYLWAARSNSR
jgi:hypothetical protein